MSNIQRQCLFFVALLVCLLFFVAPGNTSDGTSQQNGIEDFLARFNDCTWYRTPHDSYRDVYIELKNGTLTLYEYLKDELYCRLTSIICFTQNELRQMKVGGYDTTSTDPHGDVYRVVINRDGQTITIHGMDSTGGREYVTGTFVKLFCCNPIPPMEPDLIEKF